MNKKITPMMQQYFSIKEKHPDKFIFFRLGDFYEVFDQDAKEAAKLLQITLTSRNGIEMCGIPHHQLHNYIYKIINSGKKIAIVEQTEKPSPEKKIVNRKVVEIITPGMVIDEKSITDHNNYICHFYCDEKYLCFIAFDFSTGDNEFKKIQINDKEMNDKQTLIEVDTLLQQYQPNEVLLPVELPNEKNSILKVIKKKCQELKSITYLQDYYYKQSYANEILNAEDQIFFLNINSTDNESTNKITKIDPKLKIGYLALLCYFKENNPILIKHFKSPKNLDQENFLLLDSISQRNLDLVQNQFDGTEKNTFYSSINKTVTAMGSRLLKKMILKPLMDEKKINQRLEWVDFFFNDNTFLREMREKLNHVYDLERLCTKLSLNKILPTEIVSLKKSLINVKIVFESILQKNFSIKIEQQELEQLQNIIKEIDFKLLENPNNQITEGELINEQCSEELKKYLFLKKEGENIIFNLQQKERQRINSNSLKIKFTEHLGFYVELTKGAKTVPENYILKQTLVNTQRYTFEELIKHQDEILTAEKESNQLEHKIFLELKNNLIDEIQFIQKITEQIARIDVMQSHAFLALEKRYVKPKINRGNSISLKDARHPVIENQQQDFISNSLAIDNKKNIHIITGPNMAGKSTFLRQSALVIILAQMGCYVPCSEAEIGICDKIFTRVGANDNLVKGQSTFLVEMSETANILNNITDNSFVIMDEIGRGTSTYDGLSLAWGILNYLAKQKKAKVLFATHYHELTSLESMTNISNYNVLVKKENDNLIFLKKVIEGKANQSYGIEVAKLADIPKEVTDFAVEKLNELERYKNIQRQNHQLNHQLDNQKSDRKNNKEEINENRSKQDVNLLNYEKKETENFKNLLKEIDTNKITPLEALQILVDMKGKI